MDKKTTYSALAEKRKQLQFQGKHKEALKLQERMEDMIKNNQVSEEEVEGAAYL